MHIPLNNWPEVKDSLEAIIDLLRERPISRQEQEEMSDELAGIHDDLCTGKCYDDGEEE